MIAAPKTNFRIQGPPVSTQYSWDHPGNLPTADLLQLYELTGWSITFFCLEDPSYTPKNEHDNGKKHKNTVFFSIRIYVKRFAFHFVMLVSEGCKFAFFNGKDRMWSKSQPGVVTSSTSGNWRQVPRRKFSLPKEIGKQKNSSKFGCFPHEKPKKNNYNYSNHLSKFGKNVPQWMILSLSFWKVFYSSNTSLLRNVLQNNLWHIKMLLQLQQLEHNHSSILPVE